MKIIIVGNGKVGYAIARQLAVEGHDITMVDSSPVALARADSTLDLMCVEGNGASISVLEEAGARTADLVIAVSNLDETNLVCCLIAKAMGAKHTIARVRNPDYRRDAALLNLPFVERVGGDYPRMEILAESGGNRGVEFHFGDDVLPFALHFGYGRLSGCHRKGLLAFVETFGERRGDGFSRIDLHAVFAREQLQP